MLLCYNISDYKNVLFHNHTIFEGVNMDLILEGVQIMFIGMSVVGIFLVLLVFVMMLVNKLATFFDKIIPPKESLQSTQGSTVQAGGNDKLIAAAIAIAHLKK